MECRKQGAHRPAALPYEHCKPAACPAQPDCSLEEDLPNSPHVLTPMPPPTSTKLSQPSHSRSALSLPTGPVTFTASGRRERSRSSRSCRGGGRQKGKAVQGTLVSLPLRAGGLEVKQAGWREAEAQAEAGAEAEAERGCRWLQECA